MAATTMNYVVFGIAPICAIISVVIGHRIVSQLRRQTGDTSTLTSVLSGEEFRRHA